MNVINGYDISIPPFKKQLTVFDSLQPHELLRLAAVMSAVLRGH